jgi:ribosomal protein S18 acetylase RimI-like enzyme
MQTTTAHDLDSTALAAAFNLVYTDYMMPIQLNATQIEQHVRINAIDLAHSVIWRDDHGAIAGLGLLAVRGQRGWVGGFGLAPAYRGQGLSAQLLADLLAQARSLGLTQIQLEVIAGNRAAIRTYERAGFTHVRDLRIIVAPSNEPHVPPAVAASAAELPLLAKRGMQLRGTHLAWQRELPSLQAIGTLTALAIGPATAPSAYAIVRPLDHGVQLFDLAASSTETLTTMLQILHQHQPAAVPLRLANEPEESRTCALLAELGWHEPMRQHEMVLTIT